MYFEEEGDCVGGVDGAGADGLGAAGADELVLINCQPRKVNDIRARTTIITIASAVLDILWFV
jgi:hypothetical protein